MKSYEQIAKRATSLAAWFLTCAGILLMVIAIPVFGDPLYGPPFGFALFATGCIVLGLGTLRSGQLDIVYEMRLARAAMADATSHHTAPIDTNPPRRMD